MFISVWIQVSFDFRFGFDVRAHWCWLHIYCWFFFSPLSLSFPSTVLLFGFFFVVFCSVNRMHVSISKKMLYLKLADYDQRNKQKNNQNGFIRVFGTLARYRNKTTIMSTFDRFANHSTFLGFLCNVKKNNRSDCRLWLFFTSRFYKLEMWLKNYKYFVFNEGLSR